MAGRRLKVMSPQGEVEGEEVLVAESIEKWSELTLEDGSRLRIKATVVSAVRIDNLFDQEGNPSYTLNIAPTVALISAPDNLKRPKG